MVYLLQLKAELENITDFRPVSEAINWCIQYRCERCGTETSPMTVNVQDQEKLDTCDKTTNFKYRCKVCKGQCHTDVLKECMHPYNADDSGEFRTIIGFDCRGFVPISFRFLNGWQATSSENNQIFPDIDFTRQEVGKEEFYDVDEDSNSCSITEIKTEFLHAKRH